MVPRHILFFGGIYISRGNRYQNHQTFSSTSYRYTYVFMCLRCLRTVTFPNAKIEWVAVLVSGTEKLISLWYHIRRLELYAKVNRSQFYFCCIFQGLVKGKFCINLVYNLEKYQSLVVSVPRQGRGIHQSISHIKLTWEMCLTYKYGIDTRYHWLLNFGIFSNFL